MPELPITDGAGGLIQFARSAFVSYMLYPLEVERQQRLYFIASKIAEKGLELQPDPDGDVTINRQFLENLLNAPSREEIDRSVQQRSGSGIIAGSILYGVVLLHQHRPKDASVSKAIDAFIALAKSHGSTPPLSLSHVKTQWSLYKPVAAMWAAVLLMSDLAGGALDIETMPEAAFVVLLSTCEYFREMGESIVARGQAIKHGPVLDKRENYRFPSDLHLDSFEAALPPPGPEMIQALKAYRAPQRI
jgi:hypothetical protein